MLLSTSVSEASVTSYSTGEDDRRREFAGARRTPRCGPPERMACRPPLVGAGETHRDLDDAGVSFACWKKSLSCWSCLFCLALSLAVGEWGRTRRSRCFAAALPAFSLCLRACSGQFLGLLSERLRYTGLLRQGVVFPRATVPGCRRAAGDCGRVKISSYKVNIWL